MAEDNPANVTMDIIEEPVLPDLTTRFEEPVLQESSSNEQETVLLGSDNVLAEPVIMENPIPKLVFIVPYRDRAQQQEFFKTHMKHVLEDIPETDYKIYYSEQQDSRGFNRGAMKNIGFLAVKNMFPNDYQNITFVFNDVDTMPFTKNFLQYHTVPGVVKHFYGYTFALGGIVSIKGQDFERINGFPNLWAWGFEDNLLQMRVLDAGLMIDRSQFYPMMDKNIFQMKDGLERVVNRTEFDRFVNNTGEGIKQIQELVYTVNDETGFIHVQSFNTGTQENLELNRVHDLRQGSAPFKPNHVLPFNGRKRRGGSMGLLF